MSAAAMVAEALRRSGQNGVFEDPPSALACSEPIVVADAGWRSCTTGVGDGMRGTALASVLVCRDRARDARIRCEAAESAIRQTRWGSYAFAGDWSAAACATTPPEPKGRDGSGRWLWGFDVELTMKRG